MQQRSGVSGIVMLFLALAFGLLGGVGGSYFVYQRTRTQTPPVDQTPPPATNQGTGRLVVTSDQNAIVEAVKKAGPSVVKIKAAQEPTSPWEYFYGGGPREGIGSGFIVTYKGQQKVLTNHHVIAGAQKLVVKLTDGRQIEGRYGGSEESSDIGMVELVNPPADLKSAQLGSSEALQVGEWVIAIGNPYDYENTVTVGVVSAKGYRPVGEDRYQDVIQTDAAINTGNSGGPLINLAGDVVGINYRIYSTTGATVGIGFAIPISTAEQMLYFLSEGGPWAGLGETVPNSMGLAQYLGLATADGVVVVEPVRGGPAAKAGIRSRDVILAVDGTAIKGNDQMRDQLLKHRIGDTVQLTVQRGDQKLDLSVVAGRHPQARSR
jgi:S1-C subfamily serine protease